MPLGASPGICFPSSPPWHLAHPREDCAQDLCGRGRGGGGIIGALDLQQQRQPPLHICGGAAQGSMVLKYVWRI